MRSVALVLMFGVAVAALDACSSSSKPATNFGDAGSTAGATCASPPQIQDATYCSSCTFASGASPAACQNNRPVNACCAWVQDPTQEPQRAVGLHYFSSPDNSTAPNLDCLANPAPLGTPKNVTLKGFVKLFSTGDDSAGVKVEIYKEGQNGTLGALVGSYTTVADDTKDPPYKDASGNLPTWSTKCPTDGCKLRSYSVQNVPTETPLIIKTSDATGTGTTWSDLYDYNVYLANAGVDASDTASYDASTVAATDVNTVASAAGGVTIKADKGVLAGEVHDCADVRVSGAMVDTDLPHEGDMFYFTENEADPLPDKSRAQQGLGTSKLGLFGTLNISTGVPVRVSAVVKHGGQDLLLGTYTVQLYPGAVTALSFRGRRPWQK